MDNEKLVARIREGYSVTESMEQLYKNNLPLIKQWIRPYTTIEPMEDLLQQSYIGLHEAVQHYEDSRNIKFATYAEWWVRQEVINYIKKCGSILRNPFYKYDQIREYKKAVSRLEQEQGREATDLEVAAAMQLPVKAIGELKAIEQGVSSLDTPLPGMDDELTIADTLQGDLSVENEVVDRIYTKYSESHLWGIVERFTSVRENEIIKEYFINKKTMSQIAREVGVSLDRIRQIKEKGLRRLRTGRARRELLERFDVLDARIYRGGAAGYKEHNTSIVEYLVVEREEVRARYGRNLGEIEERRKERLALSYGE